MIDFSKLTGGSLRHITYNGKDSLADLGVLITRDSRTDDVAARSVQETLPYKQGVYDSSRIGGELYYDARTLSYVFKLIADTDEQLSKKREEVKEWLNSHGDYEITDSENGGYKFIDCTLKSIAVNPIDGICGMYLTATFSAYPFMLSPTGTTATLITLYEKSFTLYLLDKSVLFHPPATGLVNQPVKKITDTRYRIELGENLPDGLCGFSRLDGSIFHNNTVVSVEGAAMEKQGGYYYGYGIASGGRLTFTVTVEKPPNDYSWVGCFAGAATAYSADTLDNYCFEAYTAAHPSFTVNGAAADMKRFAIADQFVNEIAVTGSVQGMYTLKFNSVEKRL